MTTLYRAYDAADRLLYVGITDGPVSLRLDQHRRNLGYGKPNNTGWPVHMATVLVKHYPDRAAGMAAESAAIRDEDPVFNLAGRPPERFWRWMIAYPDRHAGEITPRKSPNTSAR